ncbi:MAG: multicopper oxidase family protein [Gemmatimonadota bacterium]
MIRSLSTILTLALTAHAVAAANPPTAGAQGPTATCDRENAVQPDPDLYCISLIPVPDLLDATGTVRLEHLPTPFGVAVTRDGVHRYRLDLRVAHLPAPEALGYTRYVAWATTPMLRPVIRLGEVRGGRVQGEVALEKFMVVVTAEDDVDRDEWAGRIVLRGMSASSRVLPVDDPVMLMGAGSPNQPSGGDHAGHSNTDADGWPVPPMDPEQTMLPGMMALRPDVAPYRVAGGPYPPARPSEQRRLEDGDTLRLVAAPVARSIGGRGLTMFAFNGQYPGPAIRVVRGSRIVVQFENGIGLPGAIHWHGLRLENPSDGVPHLTQDPVEPGGTHFYTLDFPDQGIYWYHAHHREDIQQELGLYGTILVEEDPAPWNKVDTENVLILDDLLLTPTGAVPPGAEAATHALMGRFGNTLLVNGESDYRLDLPRPGTARFFLANASNTRTFNLSLPDGIAMKLVGSDLGLFEREEWIESVVIAPGERYVFEVLFERPGSFPLINRVQALDKVGGRFLAAVDTFGVVRVGGEGAASRSANGFEPLRDNPAVTAEFDPYREHLDRAPDHTLQLSMQVGDLPFSVMTMMRTDSAYFHPVEWSGTMEMMNWASTGRDVRWILRDADTGHENEAIDWRFSVGEVAKIRIVNERGVLHAMHHPIHLHGQRFLVISRNGVPVPNLVWKDTFILPVGETADVLVELSNPGAWMLHCHIAEHLESGMRTVLHVDPSSAFLQE